MSVVLCECGMTPVSMLPLHRMLKTHDWGFLQFLMNTEFHESGPGAECMSISFIAFSKSCGIRIISEIFEMTKRGTFRIFYYEHVLVLFHVLTLFIPKCLCTFNHNFSALYTRFFPELVIM